MKPHACQAKFCKNESTVGFCREHWEKLSPELIDELIKCNSDRVKFMHALHKAISFIADKEGKLTPKTIRLTEIWAERAQRQSNKN